MTVVAFRRPAPPPAEPVRAPGPSLDLGACLDGLMLAGWFAMSVTVFARILS